MKTALGIALVFTAAFGSSGCKQVKEGLRSVLSEGGQEANAQGVTDAEGLPTYSSFQAIEPRTFYTLTARKDQLTVVEFYSDT